MKVIAVSGPKNAGKTTLIEKLIPQLSDRGLKTAVIKHDGHRFAADREGTDTCRLLAAGAYGVAIFDGEKYQLVKYELVSEQDLIAMYPEADLILLEGFKWTDYPKIEIVREGVSERPLCDPGTLLAIVTDIPSLSAKNDLISPDVPVFGMDDATALADLIILLLKKPASDSL